MKARISRENKGISQFEHERGCKAFQPQNEQFERKAAPFIDPNPAI